MSKSSAPARRPKYVTSAFERFSYGGFFFGQNIIYVLQLQYFSDFLINTVGFSTGTVMTLLAVSRVWDAVNDPIMGAVIDKAHFKKGRFLPWIRVSTFLIPFFLLTMFVNPNTLLGASAPEWLRLGFSFLALLLWDFSYTLSDAPLFSLATAMTPHLYERDKLMSHGRLAAALAAISSAAYPMMLKPLGAFGTVAVYCVVALLFMLPISFSAKERVSHRPNDFSFFEVFKYLFQNKPLLTYYIGYFAISATNTLQSFAIYFARGNLGNEGIATPIMAVSIIPVIVITPFIPSLIQRFGKKNLTIFSSIIAIILCVGQYFIGYQNLIVFMAVCAVRVVFMMIPLIVYGMFTADCIEYCAAKTGKRTEGISFSLQTLVTKLSGSVVTVIGLAVMSAYGYVEQLESFQSARAQEGIWIVMSILPAAGYVVMLVIMLFFYKLKESDVQAMIEANQAREAEALPGCDAVPAAATAISVPEVLEEPFVEQ